MAADANAVAEMERFLAENYGITSRGELMQRIKELPAINLAIFTQKKEEAVKNERVISA